MGWTTPEEITAHVRRLWDRGRILSASLAGEPLFPLRVTLRRPDSRALGERFEEARRWIQTLERSSRSRASHGYDVHWTQIEHRQLGRNRVPEAIVVPTEEDALRMVGMARRAARFRVLAAMTSDQLPELRDWMVRRPLLMLEHDDDWERILRVLLWFRAHPRPAVYLRQIEIPEIDTKFVEERLGLLSELLDIVLPSEAIDASARGSREFERRYGLTTKPALVRFRALDRCCSIGGLTDVSSPVGEFARLDLPIEHVFLTENEVNGLAFPDVPRSIVVFGLGYGVERLAQVPWLRRAAVHYWGDIDTHGFAILDRVRSILNDARSLMMDRETLVAHQAHWAHEPVQHIGPLARLTPAEADVYAGLSSGVFGDRVRLEQERVAFAWVKQRLREIGGG